MLGHYQLFSDSDAPKFRVSRCVDMTFMPHMHHQYEFIYMLEGEMETSVENQTRLLRPGDICLSLSNKIHRYYTPSASLCCMVIFEPEQTSSFANLMKKRDFATPFFHDAAHREEYDQIATAMLREACQHGRDPDPLVLKGYMTVFLGRIYQNASFVPRSNSTSAMQQVLEYINAHFTEPLSLNTLAEALNFSKYYISRIFNQQLGYSFCASTTLYRCLRGMRCPSPTYRTSAALKVFAASTGVFRRFWKPPLRPTGTLTGNRTRTRLPPDPSPYWMYARYKTENV